MEHKYLPFAVFAILAFHTSDAIAGASLVVDDATATPEGECQMESWIRVFGPGAEATSTPACTVAGTEFGVGISQFGHPSQGPIVSLGAKRLLRDFDQHRWGIGVSAGTVWNGEHNRIDGWNLNVPVSVALDVQRHVIAHANLGWNRARDLDAALTGGVGVEVVISKRWNLLGEVYGDDQGGSGGQIGTRYQLTGDATLDLLLGREDATASTHWFTIGFNLPLSR